MQNIQPEYVRSCSAACRCFQFCPVFSTFVWCQLDADGYVIIFCFICIDHFLHGISLIFIPDTQCQFYFVTGFGTSLAVAAGRITAASASGHHTCYHDSRHTQCCNFFHIFHDFSLLFPLLKYSLSGYSIMKMSNCSVLTLY